MDELQSIRSSSRGRRSREGGFALILAIVVAMLYFALAHLLMVDASRQLWEARRFRSRVIALTLAENGAELAARQIVAGGGPTTPPSDTAQQGTCSGELTRYTDGQFDLEGKGQSAGLESVRATVSLRGRVVGKNVLIQYSQHSQ
jgi:hypothetical protein